MAINDIHAGGHQIGVAEHNTFRIAGRPRCVHQEAGTVGVWRGARRCCRRWSVRPFRSVIGVQPDDCHVAVNAGQRLVNQLPLVIGAQDHPCP